jgi:hypothetical protein
VLGDQESATLCSGDAIPVPVRDSTVGEFEALLMNEILAVFVPLACGVKVKVNDVLWPAASVNGSENKLNLYSELFDVAEEIVTLEPLAVRSAVKLMLVPTATLPKSKVVLAKLN